MVALTTYFPFATGAGANVLEAQWREAEAKIAPTGVFADEGSEFAVIQRAAGANRSVDVGSGACRIRGHYGEQSGGASAVNLPVAENNNANPRIDLVVLRADFVNDRIELDVLQGTPAVTPAAPALTQDDSTKWEIAIAQLAVAAGFSSIVTANIGDKRRIIRPLDQVLTILTKTDSYTLVSRDAGCIIEMNKATGVNLTVPPSSSVDFPIGTQITIVQIGAGQVTVVAGSGVTIRTPDSLQAAEQYATAMLYKRGTDEWVLAGNLVLA